MKVLRVEQERCPKAKFIGKCYETGANWGEWWKNDWFSLLETQPRLPFNGDSYLGLSMDGKYWIGMLFAPDAAVPEGFAAMDLSETEYAFCYLYGPEDSKDFFTPEARALCAAAMKEAGILPKAGGALLERYACPNYTTPDEAGNVILDLGFAL